MVTRMKSIENVGLQGHLTDAIPSISCARVAVTSSW